MPDNVSESGRFRFENSLNLSPFIPPFFHNHIFFFFCWHSERAEFHFPTAVLKTTPGVTNWPSASHRLRLQVPAELWFLSPLPKCVEYLLARFTLGPSEQIGTATKDNWRYSSIAFCHPGRNHRTCGPLQKSAVYNQKYILWWFIAKTPLFRKNCVTMGKIKEGVSCEKELKVKKAIT